MFVLYVKNDVNIVSLCKRSLKQKLVSRTGGIYTDAFRTDWTCILPFRITGACVPSFESGNQGKEKHSHSSVEQAPTLI